MWGRIPILPDALGRIGILPHTRRCEFKHADLVTRPPQFSLPVTSEGRDFTNQTDEFHACSSHHSTAEPGGHKRAPFGSGLSQSGSAFFLNRSHRELIANFFFRLGTFVFLAPSKEGAQICRVIMPIKKYLIIIIVVLTSKNGQDKVDCARLLEFQNLSPDCPVIARRRFQDREARRKIGFSSPLRHF